MMLAIGILEIFIIKLRKFPSILLKIGVGFCHVLFLHLLIWWCDLSFWACWGDKFLDFQMMNWPCITIITPTWLWYIILFCIMNSIYLYFVKSFYIYSLEGYWDVVFPFLYFFVLFLQNINFITWIRKSCSSVF